MVDSEGVVYVGNMFFFLLSVFVFCDVMCVYRVHVAFIYLYVENAENTSSMSIK